MNAHEHGNCNLCYMLAEQQKTLRSEIIDLRNRMKRANKIFLEYSNEMHKWVEWERKRK